MRKWLNLKLPSRIRRLKFWKRLRTAVRNQEGKKGVGPCESLLGNTQSLGNFAKFWETEGDQIQVFVSSKLAEYAAYRSFTPEEFAAYREGLVELGQFAMWCSGEVRGKKIKRYLEKFKKDSII